MHVQDIDIAKGDQIEDERWAIDSIIMDANDTPRPSSSARIPRVPEMVRETGDYKEYYVPQVVSIGPYHFGDKRLQVVEKLKAVFAMRLLLNKETLKCLYNKLGEPDMLNELRSFYEENSTTKFSDKVFTKMMLLDSCFILYYAKYIFGGKPEDCRELRRQEIVFVHQDLFLLENQIPYKVLTEVMKVVNFDWSNKVKLFIEGTILAPGRPKRKWLESVVSFRNVQDGELTMDTDPDHLLNFLHRNLTKRLKDPVNDLIVPKNNYMFSFRNVSDLVDAGIHFGPSRTMSLAQIEFTEGWWWFSAALDLPPITVNNCTKPMLLNLTAYEMYSGSIDAWVASYVCLLDSLIDHPEDVKILRKAELLENSLGSDKEVITLFRELAVDLVPNDLAYSEAKKKIQEHCQSWRNKVIFQLKSEYLKSPWSFIALLGALIALFLSGVQAYYTAWSPKNTCDDLCMFLKLNHHL